MDRRATLSSLLALDRPLSELNQALDALDWSDQPAETLRRTHLAAVLRRYASAELSAEDVAQWASLVESREDLGFEPRHEEAIADALFDLGNPDLQGDLHDIVDDLLDALDD
ncbi:hypothetical protein [Allosphingosinicella deserti]|nr:hypothetical protein [Sphingomonas deserti]